MSEWTQVILSLGGTVVAILVIYLQVLKQHESNLEIQRESLRNEIRLELFRKLAHALREAGSATSHSLTTVMSAMSQLQAREDMAAKGFKIEVYTTSEEINEAHHEAQRRFHHLLVELEQNEIAIPEFRQMRYNANAELRRVSEAHTKLFMEFTKFLPFAERLRTGLPAGAPPYLLVPTVDDLKRLDDLANAYVEGCHDLAGYVYDFNVHAQNTLLGALFDHRVAERKPPDPTVRVLRPTN